MVVWKSLLSGIKLTNTSKRIDMSHGLLGKDIDDILVEFYGPHTRRNYFETTIPPQLSVQLFGAHTGDSVVVERNTTLEMIGTNNSNAIGSKPVRGGKFEPTRTPADWVAVSSSGSQVVDVGDNIFGLDSTGLTNDATVYTATINVDGGGAQPISIVGSTAQTYATLITELNADTTGATWSLIGGNLVATSTSSGGGSTIAIVDTDLFSSLTAFVAIDVASTSATVVSADSGLAVFVLTAEDYKNAIRVRVVSKTLGRQGDGGVEVATQWN
jgi:hypothetical protein